MWHSGSNRQRGRLVRSIMASKDKAGRATKTAAAKNLKEKRQAKREKKAGKAARGAS